MNYIAYKTFEGKALCGDIIVPKEAECICPKSIIKYNGKSICFNTSANAHEYFMRNDDGKGMERGDLINEIFDLLNTEDEALAKARWEAVEEDETCQKYRKDNTPGTWLWNHDFYNADIADLEYIKDMIEAVIPPEPEEDEGR